MQRDKKEPLYRKVNTKARGVHHHIGGEARYSRHTKEGIGKNLKSGVRSGVRRGLDYTPLYRFLLSKVGQDWDKIRSEALPRLDRESPLYHIIQTEEDIPRNERYQFSHAPLKDGMRRFTNCGENSVYSTLYIDKDNILRVVDSAVVNERFSPSCPCCTHTFNGKPFVNKFNRDKEYFK